MVDWGLFLQATETGLHFVIDGKCKYVMDDKCKYVMYLF